MKNDTLNHLLKCISMLMVCSVLVIPAILKADSPPRWDTFSKVSSNSRYIASVEISDKLGKTNPWEWKYKLRIDPINKAEDGHSWEADYRYDGYHGGLLSNDGEYFVDVSFWYYHESYVVQVYHRNQYWAINGCQLRIDPLSLQQTASHQLWLKGNDYFVEEGGKTIALMIGTVQGERRIELPPN